MDWKRIKAEYIRGGTSYRKLAEKYDVSFSTLRKAAARENWKDLRNKARAKADTKITESIGEKEAEKAAKINNVADKLLERMSAISGTAQSTQDIKNLASALKIIMDIKGIKSDADMREQEARIAKYQKDAESADDPTNDKPCGVIMMPPIMEALTPPKEDADG